VFRGWLRYYALLIDQNKMQIVRTFEGKDTVLAEIADGMAMGMCL
jgi:hypothetical protein